MTAVRLVIDTQLLVLLTVGEARRTYIARHRRTRSSRYSEEDFELLLEMVGGKTLIFVPHVLQETYYLLTRKCTDPMRADVLEVFKQLVQTMEERAESSAAAVNREEFRWLGLADAVLLVAGASGATLLTDDGKLHAAAGKAQLPTINFSHKRAARLGV